MKKQIIFFSTLLIAVALLTGVNGCKKKSETTTFNLSSLVVQLIGGTIDLNGATSATTVPTDPTIIASFTLSVDSNSVVPDKITLIRQYDNTAIGLTISVSGSKITLVPTESLANGALFTLTFPAVRATDGQSITGFVRTFKTIGTFAPSGQIAYWNFEGNANDQVGSFNADSTVNITYATSYTTAAGQAASFDGTTSIIEIPNADQLTNTESFTLCFWMKTNSEGHVDADGNPKGHFVVGLGAFYGFQFEVSGGYDNCKFATTYNVGDPNTNSHDLGFTGDGKTKDNGGWQACTYCKLLTPTPSEGMAGLLKDTWASVVFIFDGTTKLASLYINGELMKTEDFNLADPTLNDAIGMKWNGTAPDVYPRMAFGFVKSRQGVLWATQPWGGYTIPTSNHFGGLLDDVRIFHRSLTPTEIDLMYQSEKP